MNRGARETGRTFGEIVNGLDEELPRCAASRWGDPVAFTWRARRCGEAMLLALLTRDTDTRPTHRDLDAMLKDKRLEAPLGPLSRDARNRMEILQRYGNTAAHWQLDAIDHASNAADTAHALVWLVRWFYREVVKGERPGVAEALRAMEHRPTPAPPAPPSPVVAPPRPLPVALASGFVGAAVGALVLWAVIPAPRSSTVRPEPDTVEPGPVAPQVAPQPTPVRVEAPTPETPPSEPQTPPTAPTPEPITECPEGFVFVPAQTIRLRPYSDTDRPGWPPLTRPPRTVRYEVPTFCIQRRRATDLSNPSSARTNLLHREAEVACGARGWRLPTVLQWESVARTPSLQHEIVTWQSARAPSTELEWVDDAFPPVEFQRPSTPGTDTWTTRAPIPPVPYTDDRPRQSWNRHSEGRDLHIGFRCVVPPR